MPDFKLTTFQDKFVFSTARFPCFVGGVGTGKTMCGIIRMFNLMEQYGNNLGIIVRKDYTDLSDSTIKDIIRYTGIRPNSRKEIEFANGSVILLRHGTEIETLKNVNAGAIFMEQADEFTDDEVFTFLRDRLRREEAKLKSLFITANANAHDWIWKKWVNNPASKEYDVTMATTFDNKHNLPQDFIDDLMAMEKEAPNHYAQFVMNSFETTDTADLLIPYHLIESACQKTFFPEGQKILSCDVARFGDDETVISIIQKANMGWKQIYVQGYRGQDTTSTVGRIIDLKREFKTNYHIIDDIGVGGGVTDMLREAQMPNVRAFIASEKSLKPEFFSRRDECYWRLKELFDGGRIQIMNSEKLKTQLSAIRFEYRSNGQKKIVSKQDMKDLGFSSPDYADSIMMSMHALDSASIPKVNIEDTIISHYRR